MRHFPAGWRERLGVAIAVGLVAGLLSATMVTAFYRVGLPHPAHDGLPLRDGLDVEYWWRATRNWRAGINPYPVTPFSATWPLHDPFRYPLPALILFWPFSFLELPIAAGVFVGLSCGWLAWLLTRAGEWWRLLLFVGPGTYFALDLAQWSPLMTAAALLPAAGFLLTAKPTLGLACFSYRPTWTAVASALAMLFVSVLLWPAWPAWWHDATASVPLHPSPIATPFGWILVLGALRWRRPEGRLMLAMAIVPQLLCFYDQIPLMLVARNRMEAMLLSLTSSLAMLAWLQFGWGHPDYLARAAPFVLVGCYLPALVIVLRHPNEGPAPAWLERVVARFPAWARGS